MSLEWMSSHLDEWPSIKDSPEYQKQLNERVKQVAKSIEYSKQLTKVNDVLNVLDLSDEKEDALRKTLAKQDPQTLKELATKSKWEILRFIFKEKIINLKEKSQKLTT